MNDLNKNQVNTNFDYDILEVEQRIVVQQRTGEIKERLQRSAQDIWEIGQKLADVRSRLKHGQFDAWLKAEFNWSRRTAYNFISVYETFGTRANLAQLDIATSALYLLAAPSTPQTIKEEYIKRAQNGETVTHKNLQKAINSEKSSSVSSQTSSTKKQENSKTSSASSTHLDPASESAATRPEIINVVPKSNSKTEDSPKDSFPSQLFSVSTTAVPQLEHGWYQLEQQHMLFCGDTASPEFANKVPDAAFALAITSDDWDHDWIIDRARSVTIIPESNLETSMLKQLLCLFSQQGEVVIFPWLPDSNLIAIAHQLERQVYAGDASIERCRCAIAQAGLSAKPRNQ